MRIAQTLLHETGLPLAETARAIVGPFCLRFAAAWLACGVVGWLTVVCCASEHFEGFDGKLTSWKIRVADGSLDRVEHRRDETGAFRGTRAEAIGWQVLQGPATVVLEHKLPPARALDDLKLSLMVRSSSAMTLSLRVVFPRQIDPRNGQVLKLTLRGGKYSKLSDWQLVEVGLPMKLLEEQVRLLRSKLSPTVLDLRDPIVDRALLEMTMDSGRTEMLLDELHFGPIVEPVGGSAVQPAQAVDDSVAFPVAFSLDRLTVERKPFFPRMMAYHGEAPDRLRDSGFNLIWIPQAEDVALQRALRDAGLWATATPPRAVAVNGQSLSGDRASLPPIPRDCDNVLAWNLGVSISGLSRAETLQWLSQVQSADRDRQRPIMADVLGEERVFSRYLSMFGSSQHTLNSMRTIKQYREMLDQRRKLARPGSFMFTWIPTEPLPEISQARQAAGRIPMIVEPEQLRLLVYASLAAGCRGIGFSLNESLDSDSPGAVERRLAITQLNLELELLEEILASGTLVEHRPFKITAPSQSASAIHAVSFRNSAVSRADRDARQAAATSAIRHENRLQSELEAAVFRTDKAVLLLPIWYEHNAQFVPGQLAAPGATIDVSSVPETARAWEVTTTRVANLPSEPIPGGRRIKLPRFDTTATIVVTSDQQTINALQRKSEAMQSESARLWIELAKAKLERVRIADEVLTKLGVGQPDAPQLLAKARALLRDAEANFPEELIERTLAHARELGQKASKNSANVVLLRRNFDSAARLSQDCLQTLRILQRAHWENATIAKPIDSPLSSPHTLCFQTLPDHWRLLANFGKSGSQPSSRDNLLPHGDFEVLDFPALARLGWQNPTTPIPSGIRPVVQVQPASGREGRCLRLVAALETNTDAPAIVEGTPITIVSPNVPVQAGQILHISGRVRISSPISGSLQGVTLTDSLTGLTGAWHWTEKREWQPIQMLREVYQDGEFSLTLSLHGLGDVQFDDLQVLAYEPPAVQPTPGQSVPLKDSTQRPNRFDFWQRWPRFPQRAGK